MFTKHVAGILGDYTANDQAVPLHEPGFDCKIKPSHHVAVTNSYPNATVSLLTPPSSDIESEASPSRLQSSLRPSPDPPIESMLPVLDNLSREEKIARLLERKTLLEAYLESLAQTSEPVAQESLDSPRAHQDTPLPRSNQIYRQQRPVRKITKAKRVRWDIRRVKSYSKPCARHVAMVNTIRIAGHQNDIELNRRDNDLDDVEEELVFQPYRRTSMVKDLGKKGPDKAADTPAKVLSNPTLEEQRNLLLRTILAPLQSISTLNISESIQKPAIKAKRDHVLTSRQLRDLRQKNAITAKNNPIRYPRGQITLPNICLHPAQCDISNSETTVGCIKPAVVLTAPRRPEILDRIEAVAGSLQKTFPLEAELLEPYIQNPYKGLSLVHGRSSDMDGRVAQVVWDNGVGTLCMDDETRKAIPTGNVHIFMDHSNVFLSLDATLREHPLQDLPKSKRKVLSLPVLSLILQRGRAVHAKGLHLAGSSPLMQSFDPAIKLGWECSVLKRVPAGAVMHDLKQGAVDDDRPKNNRKGSKWQARSSTRFDDSLDPAIDSAPNPGQTLGIPIASHMLSATSEYETTSCSDSEVHIQARPVEKGSRPNHNSPVLPAATSLRVANNVLVGRHRMKEQAVDELLHLKILQTILAHDGKRPGTIVLATGDARGGQYNEHGFLGCVRAAISRGWQVELWAFKNGMSRSWEDCARREGWLKSGRFVVWELDHWVRELTQVVDC